MRWGELDFVDVLVYGGGAALVLLVIAVTFSSDGNAPAKTDGRAWKGMGATLILGSAVAFLIGTRYGTAVGGIQNIGLLQDRELIFSGAFIAFIGGIVCFATGALLAQSFDGGNEDQS